MLNFEKRNLVRNFKLEFQDSVVNGWTFVAPRPELKPNYSVKSLGENENILMISSNGDKYAFGCWEGEVDLEVGKWYRASVSVNIKDIADPENSILASVAEHLLLPQSTCSLNPKVELVQVFKHQKACDGNKFELYLRSTEKGCVEWSHPCVIEIPTPVHRNVKVATARFGNTITEKALLAEMQRQRISEKLEQAGALNADVVLLPEFCQIIGLEKDTNYFEAAENVPEGPTCKMLSSAAKKFGMYVIAGMIEKRGSYMFNTAVIFDRKGNFMGQYDKTHLTFGELKTGFSCGDDYPIFDLDFGRIGIHICYDEWFPEVSRYFAHKGVEILFLPVAGGKPITWRTRALDNNIYFVSSSINPPSMIIDSSGAIIAETHGDGLAFASLDLDYPKTNHYGDPTLRYGMPCIKPQMRNVIDNRLIQILYKCMKSQCDNT